MESLRDQLVKLFPELGNEDRTRSPHAVTGGGQSVPATTQTGMYEDWRTGVTPLRPDGRRINVEAKARNEPIVTRRPVPAPAPKSPTLPPVAASRPSTVAKVAQPSARQLQFGGLHQPALSREAEFKCPAPWVAAGADLQPPHGGHGAVLPIRMGIDFGTAYTKVALRVGSADGHTFFVPWSGIRNHAAAHYIPGEISVSSDGVVWLGRSPGAKEVHNDLKLPFIDCKIKSREQFGAAIAYLAWIMRYARAWLYHTQSSLLRGRTLAWTVNMGCPTDSWAARHLRFTYETLGTFAWQLSQTKRDLGWKYAVSIAGQDKPSVESIGLDGLYLMPEFVSQIYGYAKSPQRRDGLHLLMDVGAGTVDIATFNISPDREAEGDRYSIFDCKVLPLGTHYLMANRIRAIDAEFKWDDFQPVLSAQQFASITGSSDSKIVASDSDFQKQVAEQVLQLLGYTHAKRYGKAPEWREGLPVFLSGGGAGCDVYANALGTAFKEHGVPLKQTHFPLYEEVSRLNGIHANDFHRLSVAYGLTFDAESVGRILSPGEIKDAPRFDPNVDLPRDRPDRDDLYPK